MIVGCASDLSLPTGAKLFRCVFLKIGSNLQTRKRQSAIQCLTIDSIFAISAHGARPGAPNNFKRVFPHSDFSRPGTFCWISLTCRVRNAGGAEQQNSKKPTLSAESRGDPRRAAETLIWRGLEKI